MGNTTKLAFETKIHYSKTMFKLTMVGSTIIVVMLTAFTHLTVTSALPCVSDSDCYPPLWSVVGFVCDHGNCVRGGETTGKFKGLTHCNSDSDCTQLPNGQCFHRRDGGRPYCLYPRDMIPAGIMDSRRIKADYECLVDSDCSTHQGGECLQNFCIYPYKPDPIIPVGLTRRYPNNNYNI